MAKHKASFHHIETLSNDVVDVDDPDMFSVQADAFAELGADHRSNNDGDYLECPILGEADLDVVASAGD